MTTPADKQAPSSSSPRGPFETHIFPRWVDRIRVLPIALLLVIAAYAGVIFVHAASPSFTDVGYAPEQPVPYSHALHVGRLGMDCRYCHVNVEESAHAMIPPTQTCLNCHARIRAESVKLAIVRDSLRSGRPIQWVRVHDLPDYVYFDHSAHVRRGVGCVSCHGRIDTMEVVTQVEPLSMGWCLDCHRAPERHLRRLEEITRMDPPLPPKEQQELGRLLMREYGIKPSTDCSTCHR